MVAFCSTSSTEVPCRLISRDDLADLADDPRREARGRARRAAAASGWPSAPGRWRASAARRRTAGPALGPALREHREQVVDAVLRPAPSRPCPGSPCPPARRFSSTVSRLKIRRPSGTCTSPRRHSDGSMPFRLLPRKSTCPRSTRPRCRRSVLESVRSRRGLSRAVAAQHGHDAALLDLQADSAQCAHRAAIRDVEVRYLEQGRSRGSVLVGTSLHLLSSPGIER